MSTSCVSRLTHVTNKRLIFMGALKNVTIRVANILSVNQYSDGIEVEKESGKNPFFLFSDNRIFFGKILQRVMTQAWSENRSHRLDQ